MLSIFPDLLTYNLLGITIIRVVLGLMAMYLGLKLLKKRQALIDYITLIKMPFAKIAPWLIFVTLELAGIFMLVGLYTQVAAIVLAFLFLKVLFIDTVTNKSVGYNNIVYLAFIFISLSFLFLGAGAFAFDLPL